jgi:hypothetical protein
MVVDDTEILINCYKEGIIKINNDGDIVIMYPAMFYNYYFNFKRKLCGVFMDAILSKRRILAYGNFMNYFMMKIKEIIYLLLIGGW